MAYEYTREALLRPERRPVFVALDAVGAFDAAAAGFSLVNAWWLANASQLSYYDEPEIEAGLSRVGLELVRFFDDRPGPENAEGVGAQAFLATGAGFAIGSFRGTEADEPEDIRTDIEFDTCPLDGGPQVHCGFLRALDRIWTDMRPLLADLQAAGTPVWLTGHSLGAALATLAAARHPAVALYTFGSPRVGGEGLSSLLAGVAHERLVQCTDIVATVPPPPLYRHIGRLRFFTSSGTLLTEPSRPSVLRAKIAGVLAYQSRLPWLRGWVTARSLADHAIVNYIESIERSLALA